MSTIHHTAIIDANVEIAPNVTIGPYSVIYGPCRIGAGTVIGPHVVVHPYTTIGERCRLHSGAVVGDLPQDMAFDGAPSYVDIGNDCVLREGVTIHRGTKPESRTVVGDGCFLMAFSHLGHNVKLGRKVIVVNAALLAGYVEVDDEAFISGTAVVHQFVKIGRNAMLGGQAGIGKDVPPYCTAESSKRNKIIGLNAVGLKRAGYSLDDRRAIKQAYNLLYRSGLNTKQAAEQIKERFPDGPAAEFWKFIERSNRGLCGASAE